MTLVPIIELRVTLPLPLPELVIVPVWFAVATVMPLAVLPSFLRIKLPFPDMPPDTDRVPF